MDRSRPQSPDQHPPEQVSGLGNEIHGLFFTIKTRQTGAAIYTQVVLFLSEAALAGVVGNALYDGVRSTLRTIAGRWRSRREHDRSAQPTPEEAAELIRAAVRLKLNLTEQIVLATEELTRLDDSEWRASVTNTDTDERYRVRLHTSGDLDQAVVLVYGR